MVQLGGLLCNISCNPRHLGYSSHLGCCVIAEQIERRARGLVSYTCHVTSLLQVLDEASDGHRMCVGADVLDQHAGRMTRFVAPSTFLATGGAGQA